MVAAKVCGRVCCDLIDLCTNTSLEFREAFLDLQDIGIKRFCNGTHARSAELCGLAPVVRMLAGWGSGLDITLQSVVEGRLTST